MIFFIKLLDIFNFYYYYLNYLLFKLLFIPNSHDPVQPVLPAQPAVPDSFQVQDQFQLRTVGGVHCEADLDFCLFGSLGAKQPP